MGSGKPRRWSVSGWVPVEESKTKTASYLSGLVYWKNISTAALKEALFPQTKKEAVEESRHNAARRRRVTIIVSDE